MTTVDPKKINISSEEAKNMAKLMKDPEFMKMFVDYAKEISDPKNKEDMETALRHAESRGEKVPGFPEGKELLIPIASFCAKTKNDKTGLKVFINICHSDKVNKAIGKEKPDKSGTEWEIPYSLGPPTKATDKDFALPRLKYKGVLREPKILTISKGLPQESPPRVKEKGIGKEARCVHKDLGPIPSPTSTIKSSTEVLTTPVNSGPCEGHDQELKKLAAQEVEPIYKVVYRNGLDLAQFWGDKANLKVGQDEVKEIVVRVHLPGVVELSDIVLSVTQSEISVVVPRKYNLKVALKYQVDDGRGQAKFDKDKPLYQLEVILPVIKRWPRVQHDNKTLMM